jgi:pyridoxal phosphate phosphatase PHOSPHO2
MQKNLAVFDFDHTLLDDNSDTAVIALADKDNIPKEIKAIQHTEGWTAFMQAVFIHLRERGVTSSEIKELIKSLPPVNGVLELIKELKKTDTSDIIIISDCNSIFIKIWLESHGIDKFITKTFTNPSEVVNDTFKIFPYHHQETCKLSTKNLCKGQVLEEFVAEQNEKGINYDRIVYTGDGVNDFCPVLRLHTNDLACVRNNFKLLELVTQAKTGKSFDNSGKPHVVKAEVFVWDSGIDILQHIKH